MEEVAGPDPTTLGAMRGEGVITMMGYGNQWILEKSAENNDWNSMGELMKQMMKPYQSGGGLVFWQLHWVFELVTWVLLLALLLGLVRWVWKKGDK